MEHFYDALIHKQIDTSEELQKIQYLLTEERLMLETFHCVSLLQVIDAQFFRKIQAKGNCVNVPEFLGFPNEDYGSADAIDGFCQFIERLSTLFRQVKPLLNHEPHGMMDQIDTIQDLIDEDLHLLGFDLHYQAHPRYGDIAFVCHKSAEAMAAISLAPNETIAEHIFRYLRVLDTGTAETKRVQLGEIYFGLKPLLDTARKNGIEISHLKCINTLINNLNIRHPNAEGIGSESTPFLKTTSNAELIKMYDTLFALLLNAITQLDVASKEEFIKEIISKINEK